MLLTFLNTLATIISVISLLIVTYGVLVGFIAFLRNEIKRFNGTYTINNIRQLRADFGSYLLLGLEFLIASDILKTVVDPTLDELAILGGVVVVRTVLSVFLNKEIKELADGCRYPVVFAGCVTQSRLAELYNDCDIFVLPSMYEGLPLTVIESLACGDRVVMTKLEGIAEWLADMVPDADIRYVLPPGMKGTDEPLEEELPAFESRLAEALREAIEEKDTKECDVSRISWQKIAREVIR